MRNVGSATAGGERRQLGLANDRVRFRRGKHRRGGMTLLSCERVNVPDKLFHFFIFFPYSSNPFRPSSAYVIFFPSSTPGWSNASTPHSSPAKAVWNSSIWKNAPTVSSFTCGSVQRQ